MLAPILAEITQPVVSQDVGWGMVILTALTLAKATVSEVIGYFKDRTANDKKYALLEAEHATCKRRTDELEEQIRELKTESAELKHEMALLRADMMARPNQTPSKGKP
jgi:septal ring factor EnvC (AmiA/AmiB activator)